ncbi:unnamed protein product [Merluccius merluccius]
MSKMNEKYKGLFIQHGLALRPDSLIRVDVDPITPPSRHLRVLQGGPAAAAAVPVPGSPCDDGRRAEYGSRNRRRRDIPTRAMPWLTCGKRSGNGRIQWGDGTGVGGGATAHFRRRSRIGRDTARSARLSAVIDVARRQ